MIHTERVSALNTVVKTKGDYVIYWMQASQRVHCNHALEMAISYANECKIPLIVYFELISDFPEANVRHYTFMLEGLEELKKSLIERNIKLIIHSPALKKGVDIFMLDTHARLIVTDAGYTRFQKSWRKRVAENVNSPFIQMETDVIVPIRAASKKEEYSARTLRNKITPLLDEFIASLDEQEIIHSSLSSSFDSLEISNIPQLLSQLKIDDSVPPVSDFYKGGESSAQKRLHDFIEKKIAYYDEKHNDPSLDYVSHLSPYLHFGQISALQCALEIRKSRMNNVASFLDELIIRRELSMNFVNYNQQYDSFSCLPEWAQKTLKDHVEDPRDYIYARSELENAQAHDEYWNAAQKEMVLTGTMHGYMRMYWGKKIIEWTEYSQQAYQIALYLNNKYELDGRDPNGFAGVAWCFGKHDQGWKERPIFGKVRYMNAKGLERKFAIKNYVEKIMNIEKMQRGQHG